MLVEEKNILVVQAGFILQVASCMTGNIKYLGSMLSAQQNDQGFNDFW